MFCLRCENSYICADELHISRFVLCNNNTLSRNETELEIHRWSGLYGGRCVWTNITMCTVPWHGARRGRVDLIHIHSFDFHYNLYPAIYPSIPDKRDPSRKEGYSHRWRLKFRKGRSMNLIIDCCFGTEIMKISFQHCSTLLSCSYLAVGYVESE